MNIKRAVFMAVLVVAIAALAVPLVGLRAAASGSSAPMQPTKAPVASPKPIAEPSAPVVLTQSQNSVKLANGQEIGPVDGQASDSAQDRISPDTLRALGFERVADKNKAAERTARRLRGGAGAGQVGVQAGEPELLNGRSALSDALIFTEGGRDTQFQEVGLLADWDGREDCAADRSHKVDDFSFVQTDPNQTLTRAAISEHTIANGFNENIFYYGDSVGNLWIGADTTGDGRVDSILQVNLVNTLNAFGTINSDDQVTITGIAVNPVADLGSFSHVNGSYSPQFGPTVAGTPGVIGEILYVTYTDTESGLRLAAPNNTLVRSGLLAFPVSDVVSPAPAAPGVISFAGFPVTVGGAFGVAFSTFSNVAGCSVDDDGSVYFQQVDLIQFTGANIVKVTSTDDSLWQDRSLATNGFLTITSLNPTNRDYGTATGPTGGGVSQINRFKNYSGTSTLFGDIVAIASGPCNVLYAAVSPSFVTGPVSFDQLGQGLFPAPSAFASGTPSMVISFADCSGAFDTCSGVATGSVTTNVGGTLPIADGLADPATSTVTTVTPGVNNFRIFVQGNGPTLTPAVGGTAVVPGTLSNALKIDMQIDFSGHAGLAVSGEGTVFVISGGEPAGVGKSPSPMLGEILCFEDACPADRRADFVDLRGDVLPNPPVSDGNTGVPGPGNGGSGGNIGDGDSDRFDHIFWQAPIDITTLTPTGVSGLARGFLRYTNRLAPNPIGPGVTLGQTTRVLSDDGTAGNIIFEQFDPGHQVAGGDDQNPPFRGDDDNGAGTPTVPGPLSGGFEFTFGGPVGTAACVWNGFFLNANGSITFGAGDSSFQPTVPAFRSGLPKIAPAWADLNPGSRDESGFLNTFPLLAMGFENVNAFRIRWINVPEVGFERCIGVAGAIAGTSINTFSITLFDDGTGIDENANQPLNPANPIGNNAVPFDLKEGPTDLRYTKVLLTNPVGGFSIVGCNPRPEGSGIFGFEYCRMDLLGTESRPVIAGYSIGFLSGLNPPGLCESNLSVIAAAADAGAFGVLAGNQTAAVGCNCCIGEGTEPTIFELFNEGRDAGTGAGGEVTFAKPNFDLRFEGNDAALCTSTRQPDLNRGHICFLGIGCAPPSNPVCTTIIPGTFVTTPTTTGIVNSLCAVQLNIVGCGFFPNEQTTICQGFAEDTGIPLQRAGKTVTTTATLACDTNNDGVPEAVIALTTATPVSCNLVTATIPVSTSFGSLSSSGFPAACCGGPSVVTVTQAFGGPAPGATQNNIFGAFTRTTSCALLLGTRAPVVFSVTPSGGDCSLPDQDLLITGACFSFTQFIPGGGPNGENITVAQGVTSVCAVDISNPANVICARTFVVLNANLIDAHFNFTSANAGKTFLIFVTGPGGTSRNLTTLPTGSPAGCSIGNEQGIQVTFKCNAPGNPNPGPTPEIATVTGCKLDRQDTGQFILDVTGTGIKEGATATVGGVTPKKIKVIEVVAGTNNPSKLRLVKKVCGGLPGNVIITNPAPNGAPSAPFLCQERCPAN